MTLDSDLQELALASYDRVLRIALRRGRGDYNLPSYLAYVNETPHIYFEHIRKAFNTAISGLEEPVNIAEMGCSDGIISLIAYRILNESGKKGTIQALEIDRELTIIAKQNSGRLPIKIRNTDMLDPKSYNPAFSEVDVFYAYHLFSLEEDIVKFFASKASEGARLIIPRNMSINRMEALLKLNGVSGRLVDPREIGSFYKPEDSYIIFQKK